MARQLPFALLTFLAALWVSPVVAQAPEAFLALQTDRLRDRLDLFLPGTSQPQVADTDGDGLREAYTVTFEGKLYGIEADGRIRQGFPFSVFQYMNWLFEAPVPAVADLDGDGQKEIIIAVKRFGFGPVAEGRIFVVRNNGQPFGPWPVGGVTITNPGISPGRLHAPRIARINGVPHIVAGVSRQGIKVYTPNGALVSARDLLGELVYQRERDHFGIAIADFDADGSDEIVVQSDVFLHVFYAATLTDKIGFPRATYISGLEPVIADLNADGNLEIISTSTGLAGLELALYQADGTRLHAFRSSLPFYPDQDLRIIPANIQGDSAPELIVAGVLGPQSSNPWTLAVTHMQMYSANGSLLGGFPIQGQGGYQGPRDIAAVDVTLDGRAEILVSDMAGMTIYSAQGADLGGLPISAFRTPPVYATVSRHTAPIITDLRGDGDAEIVVSLLADVTSNGAPCMAGMRGLACQAPVIASLNTGYRIVRGVSEVWANVHGDIENSRRLR